MNIIRNKWLFLSFSIILVAVSIYGIAVFGLKRGIDFTGGTLWQVKFTEQEISKSDFESFVRNDLKLSDAAVNQSEGETVFNLRSREISEVSHQEYSVKIEEKFGSFEELSFQTIGAAIGAELVRKALWAFIINLLAISLYVAYAFRKVSYPVNSWKYSAITLLTLFHDALIPLGLMTFLGHFLGVEIDTNFIVAILVVMGFSVHDTIVVFDRIRENLRTTSLSKMNFDDLVNNSVHQTFHRSVNTSLTLVIVLVALLVLGSGSLKFFILTILVGTVVGTYSSIFVASPLLTLWKPKTVTK